MEKSNFWKWRKSKCQVKEVERTVKLFFIWYKAAITVVFLSRMLQLRILHTSFQTFTAVHSWKALAREMHFTSQLCTFSHSTFHTMTLIPKTNKVVEHQLYLSHVAMYHYFMFPELKVPYRGFNQWSSKTPGTDDSISIMFRKWFPTLFSVMDGIWNMCTKLEVDYYESDHVY
jgi:hypothetical protein